MNSFFEELFEYNFTMNRKVIEKLSGQAEIPSKCSSLFNHILSAHHIWNHRILNDKASFSVWPDISTGEYGKINADNFQLSLEILKKKNLQEVVSYTNSKGERFSNTVKDILFHVINHSNYHRAQIATSLKESGIAPVVSDYIFYKRS